MCDVTDTYMIQRQEPNTNFIIYFESIPPYADILENSFQNRTMNRLTQVVRFCKKSLVTFHLCTIFLIHYIRSGRKIMSETLYEQSFDPIIVETDTHKIYF